MLFAMGMGVDEVEEDGMDGVGGGEDAVAAAVVVGGESSGVRVWE